MSNPGPTKLYNAQSSAYTPSWSHAYTAWRNVNTTFIPRPHMPATSPGNPQTLHLNVALASAFEAYKLFISASRLLPQELSHETAIGKVQKIVEEEVARLGREKGLSGAEIEKATNEAHRAVRDMYEEWYITTLECNRFEPGKENWRVVEVLGQA